MNDQANHHHCTTQFIELANKLKNSGMDSQLISAALMSASGIYATYVAAGNSGALEPSGVEKISELYRRNLEHIQDRKKEEIQAGQQAAPESKEDS